MTMVLALRRYRQEDPNLKAVAIYTVSLRLAWVKLKPFFTKMVSFAKQVP